MSMMTDDQPLLPVSSPRARSRRKENQKGNQRMRLELKAAASPSQLSAGAISSSRRPAATARSLHCRPPLRRRRRLLIAPGSSISQLRHSAPLSCSTLAAAVHWLRSTAHSAQPTRRSATPCFDPPPPRLRPLPAASASGGGARRLGADRDLHDRCACVSHSKCDDSNLKVDVDLSDDSIERLTKRPAVRSS